MAIFYEYKCDKKENNRTIIHDINEKDGVLYRGKIAREILDYDVIQYVPLITDKEDGTLWLACDENGLIYDLPFNFYLGASDPQLFLKSIRSDILPVQKIVGNVLFVRTKAVDLFNCSVWDYEITDLLPKDVEFINALMSKEAQERFDYFFKICYGGK